MQSNLEPVEGECEDEEIGTPHDDMGCGSAPVNLGLRVYEGAEAA